MIGLDTNVVVRLLTGDDAEQQRVAQSYLAHHCTPEVPAWINRIVTVELVWVLERGYKYSREQIAGALEKLLHTAELAFEDHDHVRAAVSAYRLGAGFADTLLGESNRDAGCTHTVTFDRAATRSLATFLPLV